MAVRTEVTALVVPALTTATEKWADHLGRALEPIVAAIETQGAQMMHLCDELGKVSKDGAEVALRMRDLEAMARYAAPGLSDRYVQRGKLPAP